MLTALCFAAANHAQAFEHAVGLGDHGALPFVVVFVVKIDDDPVPGPSELVGARSVREKRGEMPGAPVHVHDWQPRFSARVEAVRSDAGQLAGARGVPILTVDRQQHVSRGLVPAVTVRPFPLKHLAERCADTGGAAFADTRHFDQASVVGGYLVTDRMLEMFRKKKPKDDA